MYPQSFWLFRFKLKILKHFKQIRSHLNDYIELSSIPSEAVLRMFFMQALLLSPRAHFLSPRASFLSPRASFFVSPSASEGSLGTYAPREDIAIRHPERSEGYLATLGTTGGGALQWEEISRFARNDRKGLSPRASFFVTPRRKPRGSLGTYAPREDRVGNVAPRRKPRGSLSACAPREDSPGRRPERSGGCLANARQDKARDASLSLGRTE
jgi:hypothetical protein